MRVRRPAVHNLGEPHFVLAQSLAVRFLGVLAVRRSETDVAIDDDQRRPVRLPLRRLDGDVDQSEIVDVADAQHIPVPALEARGHVVAEGQRSVALDGDVIVVVEPDQVGQPEMSGDRGRFVADAFHQVAIAAERVNAVVKKIAVAFVELRGQPALRHRHADGVATRPGPAGQS